MRRSGPIGGLLQVNPASELKAACLNMCKPILYVSLVFMCMHICVPLCAGTSRRSTAARPGTAGCEAGMAQCIQDGRRPQPSFLTATGFDKHVEFKHALPSKMAATPNGTGIHAAGEGGKHMGPPDSLIH